MPIRKKEFKKIELWKPKNDKIKKIVKDQVKEISTISKSYNDWSKDILRVATNLCGIHLKKVKRQKTTWVVE